MIIAVIAANVIIEMKKKPYGKALHIISILSTIEILYTVSDRLRNLQVAIVFRRIRQRDRTIMIKEMRTNGSEVEKERAGRVHID